MTKNISIGGEVLSPKAAMNLIASIQYDARQMAGEFHGMKRSDKFRVNWPDENIFVDANWKSFVAPVRAMYAEKLADPKTNADDKRRFYLALLVERAWSEGQRRQGVEADNRLQVHPGTQQFAGDPYDNKKIVNDFGKTPNFRAQLRAGAAKIARMH